MNKEALVPEEERRAANPPYLDEETKQQREIRITIDKNVAVSAGAGSGKTKVLGTRFIYILQHDQGATNADDIIAITFTRKAAGEMKTRIREYMQKEVLHAADDDSRQFWRNQLQALDKAFINTIHGLCSRILRENPVEADLDPAFTVAEDFEGEEFLEDCLNKYLRKKLEDQDASVMKLVQAYGYYSITNQLQSLLPNLQDLLAIEDFSQAYINRVQNVQEQKEELCITLRDLAENRSVYAKKGATLDKLTNLAENIDAICDAVHSDTPCFAPMDAAIGGVQARGKIAEPIKNIRSLRTDIELAVYDKIALEYLPAWQQVLQELGKEIAEQKKALNLLTYDDLETMALALLEQHDNVRAKYHERFKYIMVDEFQDTNDRQRRLIFLLCGDKSDVLQGNKLFIVGDPKQSIYRFRGAEVKVFNQVSSLFDKDNQNGFMRSEGEGCFLPMNFNFRSKNKILDAVNAVFEPLMGTKSIDKDPNKVNFEALNYFHEGETLPELLLVPYDKEEPVTATEKEADAVAKAMLALHGGQTPGGQAVEPVAFNKMGVLLRAMTHVEDVDAALENNGIPYQIVDGKGFYGRQEVLDLLNLFIVLHNRYRSIELAGVLRSPYFGLDDETITKLFLSGQGCLWDALQKASVAEYGEQGVLLERAQKNLAHLRNCASLVAVPELLVEVWQCLRVDTVLSMQEHGVNKLANAEKLRQLAQSHCVAKQGTLADWLDYVRRVRAAEARETAANVDDDDAVQIMTIHKAKGLDFGTVFLPFLGGRMPSDTAEVKYLSEQGLGIKVPLPDGTLEATGVLKDMKALDKVWEQEERKRQLYVAMTRPKDMLFMSGIMGSSKGSKALAEMSWLQQLSEILKDSPTVKIVEYTGEDVEAEKQQQVQVALSCDESFLAPLSAFAANGRRTFSATALQTYLHCPRQYFYWQVANIPGWEEEPASDAVQEPTDGRLPAVVVGNVVHRALELYRPADVSVVDTAKAEAAFAAAVEEYAQGGNTDPAKAMYLNYLASDLYKQLPVEKQRERAFVLPGKYGLLINGVIDCLAQDAGGQWQLVDYKTGRPPTAGKNIDGYYYQLAIYKEACRQLWGIDVTSAKLHFLQDLTAVALPTDRDYLQAAYALCEEMAQHRDEQDFPCKQAQKDVAGCAYCPYNYLCTQK